MERPQRSATWRTPPERCARRTSSSRFRALETHEIKSCSPDRSHGPESLKSIRSGFPSERAMRNDSQTAETS